MCRFEMFQIYSTYFNSVATISIIIHYVLSITLILSYPRSNHVILSTYQKRIYIASKILNFIKHNLYKYSISTKSTAYVRICSSVWDPHLAT